MYLERDFNKLVGFLEKAGQILKEKFIEKHFGINQNEQGVGFRYKEARELLVDEDLISQDIIIKELEKYYPGFNIYSEELNNLESIRSDGGCKFILDPLDGTHNFCYGNSCWGIALACLDEENRPVAAVMALPMLDLSLMVRKKTKGAYLIRKEGERPLRAAACKDMKEAIVCYDNQFYKLPPEAFTIYKGLADCCFTTRITGSAVYDGSMVALGKMSARIWNSTNSYDIAASLLIVEEAGGLACNFKGEKATIFDKEVIVCANEIVKEGILKVIKEAKK